MKMLALFQDIPRPDFDELRKLEEDDKTPRAAIFTIEFDADVLDRKMLQRAPAFRRALYKFLPVPVAQVIEAFCIHKQYDIVLSWQEQVAFPFALLCKLTGNSTVPHVALCSWPSKGAKGSFLRLVHSHIDRIILWSTVQRNIVVNELKIPPSQVAFMHYFVDEKFFRPMDVQTDMICSVGSEMRDFPTLLEALRCLDIKCHVAVGTWNMKRTSWVRKVDTLRDLPPNITIGRKSASELRELYARSRFVVIPLLPSDTDNGVTCILEAMAMAKPVICSRTVGQVDVIKDGQTGIYVPVGDSAALRSAIEYLWNNPKEAERMGREGRKYVETCQRLDDFVGDIKEIVEKTIASRRREHRET